MRQYSSAPAAAGDLAAAVAADQAQSSEELLNIVITSLFAVGLSLQAAAVSPADLAKQQIEQAVQRLDDTIRIARNAAFNTREGDHGTGLVAAEFSSRLAIRNGP
ncbi:MAG TPA: hypothetical protein VNF47_15765 [Streptosporangiaceae bacterium]|nr:hypothetical protein [Streptosporangiaceae bacterium]